MSLGRCEVSVTRDPYKLFAEACAEFGLAGAGIGPLIHRGQEYYERHGGNAPCGCNADPSK